MTLTWAITENVTVGGANQTLAQNNLTGTAANQGARIANAAAQGAGKYYFEMTIFSFTGGANVSVGVGDVGTSFTDLGGSVKNCAAVYMSDGQIYSLAATTSKFLGAITTSGDVVGVAVDLDNRKIWFRKGASGNWNNDGAANPATNTNGVALPATGVVSPYCAFGGTSGNSLNGIFRVFDPPFSGVVPSGFTKWPDTQGTLYNETIQNGYAKLLNVSTVSTPVTSIDVSCAYAGFDSYLFELDQLFLDNLILLLRASSDNGATYPATGCQWVLHTMFLGLAGPYRSYANGTLGVYDYTQLSHAAYPANAISGRVRLSPDARSNILFKTAGVHNTNYEQLNWGCTYFDGVGGPVNKLRFFPHGGGSFSAGSIRTYGFRTGA